jgi:rhodanese-related sulfurtransferase
MRRATIEMLCALALLMAWPAGARAEKFGELSVDEVAKKSKDKTVHVYDCNPRDEYLDGHVPGAKWVDFSHVTAADLPADKHAMLIFYCENEH